MHELTAERRNFLALAPDEWGHEPADKRHLVPLAFMGMIQRRYERRTGAQWRITDAGRAALANDTHE